MQSRSRRARILARRVVREPERTTIQWSSLASVWLHAALLLAGLQFEVPAPIPAEVRYYDQPQTELSPSTARGEQPIDLPVERTEQTFAVERITLPRARPEPKETKLRFARTEEEGEPPLAPTDRISAHDQRALQETRAPVLSDQPGLPTPPTEGPSDLSAAPTLQRRPGDADSALGNSTRQREEAAVRGAGGGVEHPTAIASDGEGIPTDGGAQAPGGALGGGRQGADGSASPGVAAQIEVTAPEGPDPTLTAVRPAPSWWQPAAMRLVPAPEVRSEGAEAPSTLVAMARAPVERAARQTATGGTERASDAPSLPDPGAGQGTRRRIAAPGTADPVEELRQDLGFGPLDRSKFGPRPAWAGELHEQGTRSTSPQVAVDVPIAWKTAVSTRGTALGAYIQRVEELIAARWNSQDLDAHSRAMGIQGSVTVRYRVNPDGRTRGVVVVRSSGNPILDRMALSAIPARLPRIPRDVGREPIQHEITLHYRNPLVTP